LIRNYFLFSFHSICSNCLGSTILVNHIRSHQLWDNISSFLQTGQVRTSPSTDSLLLVSADDQVVRLYCTTGQVRTSPSINTLLFMAVDVQVLQPCQCTTGEPQTSPQSL
jgi:hypothetical protein